jgi:hypothetical protein
MRLGDGEMGEIERTPALNGLNLSKSKQTLEMIKNRSGPGARMT